MRPPALLIVLSVLSLLVSLVPARAQSADQSALNTEVRIGQLEDRIRDLTGRIEELTNNLTQMKQQLDRLSSDVDVRFNQLQQPQPPSAPGAASAPPPPQPPQSKPSQGAGDLSQPASQSGSLGTLPAPAPGSAQAPPSAAAPPPPSAAPSQQTASAQGELPSGSVQDQYNFAMGLLTQANYPAAEQAMRSFVARWPKDPLAGNAQYWLGETFYVRKDYGNAATAFAQGYEKYPKSAKAADDLLKLGMSLANLNQKPDACRAYARLQHDFQAAGPPIKDRLASEKQRAGC
jgi:tol-pal system protein YbgF